MILASATFTLFGGKQQQLQGKKSLLEEKGCEIITVL